MGGFVGPTPWGRGARLRKVGAAVNDPAVGQVEVPDQALVGLRALHPLIWSHVTPYGTFSIDLAHRLTLSL